MKKQLKKLLKERDERLNTYSHMYKNKLNNIINLIDDLNETSKGITKSSNEMEDLKDIISNQKIQITNLEKDMDFSL